MTTSLLASLPTRKTKDKIGISNHLGILISAPVTHQDGHLFTVLDLPRLRQELA